MVFIARETERAQLQQMGIWKQCELFGLMTSIAPLVGANRTARCGYLDVVPDLRAHVIHCTPCGANVAAMYGFQDVVGDLALLPSSLEENHAINLPM